VNSKHHHPIVLPHVVIPGNIFLAPLAGYTDMAFRSIAIDYGADFTFTEMISAEAIKRNNQKTFRLALRAPNETLYGIQIFSGDPAAAAAAVKSLKHTQPALFDLNCGCSVPKILKSGAGAQLLREPKKIGAIVKAMVEAGAVGVSVKLRLGWDADSHTYLQAAEAAVNAGACLVTLHPRTRSQGFKGQAEWSCITALRKIMPVPVFGSGDLFTSYDAKRMFEETDCDGIMFARGAIGHPFLFRDTVDLLEQNRPPTERDMGVRIQVILHHLNLLRTYKPEIIAAREMRKHCAHYTKGLPCAAALRQEINSAATFGDYHRILGAYLTSGDQNTTS
jgi:nifR3 family TIM-barrel protein